MKLTDRLEAKKCPLCGGDVEFLEKGGKTKCSCSKCYLSILGLWFDSENSAVSAWNSAVDEMLERR